MGGIGERRESHRGSAGLAYVSLGGVSRPSGSVHLAHQVTLVGHLLAGRPGYRPVAHYGRSLFAAAATASST